RQFFRNSGSIQGISGWSVSSGLMVFSRQTERRLAEDFTRHDTSDGPGPSSGRYGDIEPRGRRHRTRIGPGEGGVVNADALKKARRPGGGLQGLKNDRLALAADGHGCARKPEFVRQTDGLPLARFDNVRGSHEGLPGRMPERIKCKG